MSRRKIALVGFGSLGEQILSLLEDSGSRKSGKSGKPGKQNWVVDFFDDHLPAGKHHFPFADFRLKPFRKHDFYVGLGYRHLPLRRSLIEELLGLGCRVPPLVHRSVLRSPSCVIEEGALILPGCNLDRKVRIGRGTILHNSVTVCHDSEIGECSYLGPGVVLSGRSRIGSCTFVGSGTAVSNDVTIGENVRIGIGSVVTKNIGDGCSAIGNPIRLLNHPLNIR